MWLGEIQPESPRGLRGELSDASSSLFCNAGSEP